MNEIFRSVALGLTLNPKRKDSAKGIESKLSAKRAASRLYVIPVNEELIIAGRPSSVCIQMEEMYEAVEGCSSNRTGDLLLSS